MTNTEIEQGNSAEFVAFTIQGKFQDGLTSRSEPAKLLVNAQGAKLVAADVSLELVPESLSVSDRIGDTPRRIEWGSEAVFVTNENEAADRLQQLLPGGTLGRVAFRLESNLALAIGALLFVGLLFLAFMTWGVPSGARYLAAKIPDSLARRAGDEVLQTLDKLYLEPSKLAPDRAVELRSYLTAYDSFPPRIEFRFAGKELGPNAFALPGGYVVITDELIALAESDEEILAVYLHEVGHARNYHAETGVLANSAWLVVLTLVTGDISGMTETIFAVPVFLGQLAFSRELEREADDYSISKLKEHALDPTRLAAILERMNHYSRSTPDTQEHSQAEENPKPEHHAETAEPEANDSTNSAQGTRLFDYLSTHPSTAERLERIRAAAQ